MAQDQGWQPPLFVLDTETNGFMPPQLIQLAFVRADAHVVFDQLFRVDGPIHPRATEKHGFVLSDLVHEPRFEQRADQIHNLLDGAWVLAYNASFDQRVLEWEFHQLGQLQPRVHYRDLMRPATKRIRGSARARFVSLQDACAYFVQAGLGPCPAGDGARHRARADALCALGVARALLADRWPAVLNARVQHDATTTVSQ
jgi:DNA polymerase III epsilon subunit-like protein